MSAGVALLPCWGRHSNPVWAQWAGMPSAAADPHPCWLKRQAQPCLEVSRMSGQADHKHVAPQTDLFSCRLEWRSWLRSEPRSEPRSEERGWASGRPIMPITGGPGSTACPAYFVSSSVCLSRMAFQPRYCLPSKWSCRGGKGRSTCEAGAAAAAQPERGCHLRWQQDTICWWQGQ